jgi:hypothetical protein
MGTPCVFDGIFKKVEGVGGGLAWTSAEVGVW